MTLEKAINAVTATSLSGVSAVQQSIAAKHRWNITKSARSALGGELLTKAGMNAMKICTKS